jgi:hypothetical protein
MKSSYQIAQEVKAARAKGLPIWYVEAEIWKWGVYIAPCFAEQEDAEAEAARCNARGDGYFVVKCGS